MDKGRVSLQEDKMGEQTHRDERCMRPGGPVPGKPATVSWKDRGYKFLP